MSEMDKYVETFRQEAEELLVDIEEVILAIEENPNDKSNIDRLFRAIHTIKGSGGMFGFTDIAAFAHHVETALDKVRDGVLSVSRELIDVILESRDQISSMLNAHFGGSSANPVICEDIIGRLGILLSSNELPSSILKETLVETVNINNEQTKEKTYEIRFSPDSEIFLSGMDPSLLLDELNELGDCKISASIDDLPPVENMNPEKCYLSWNLTITTEASFDDLKDVFIFVEDSSQIEIKEIEFNESKEIDSPYPKLGSILLERNDVTTADLHNALSKQKKLGEILVDAGAVTKDKIESALSEQKTIEKQNATAKNETVRVPSDKLDKLINLVGELVINQAQLTQIATSVDNSELASSVEEADRLAGELRDIVLSIRMMPIGTTFSRFKRLVRDMSVELGKEIDLVTEGAETEMDKTVIDRLADPLVHLIRNSIDHGIEMPNDRLAFGKSSNGTIRLAAEHHGTNVVISIHDDGKGLDYERIRNKGIEKGLISADVELSEKEVFSLIFAPGFSTATNVTNISGRGVGMDVVRREIDALRGSIDISSVKDKGTVINLSLPLTLAIIEGLLVEVGSEKFVIPLSVIEECLELTESRFAMSCERNVIQVRGDAVPFIRLREIFGISSVLPELEETIVVKQGDFRIGVVVDHVIGDYQTVIKSLGGVYKDIDGICGATILGDGTVALILDITGLIKCAKIEEAKFVPKLARAI